MTCPDAPGHEPARRRAAERAPTVRLVRRPPAPLPQPELDPPDDDLTRRVKLVRPILALELGAPLGWALRWDAEHAVSGAEVLAPGERPAARLAAFRAWLRELLELTRAALVVYREPGPRSAFPLQLEGVLLAEVDGTTDHVPAPRRDASTYRRPRRREVTREEQRALAVLAWTIDVLGEPNGA